MDVEDGRPSDVANSFLRKFSSPDVGWLVEETDDATYEKYISMTEVGIALAEFLINIEKPEKVEYSTYIYNIYNTLNNETQWKDSPYINCLKPVYKNAKALSKSLKSLSTFIRKTIEDLIKEVSLETLTENLLSYCNGDFIKEYARLTKQQNIHIYRRKPDDSKYYKNCRECHIEPDWLLVYKYTEGNLVLLLFNLGSHSELFK